jgi:ABC-type multidrug transport system fused ATPase/permease subunit
LNKNIWDILKDKTGIVIAHRLSTILDADKIVVVDEGKVVGIGKHQELLKSCDFYKKLVDAQNISF